MNHMSESAVDAMNEEHKDMVSCKMFGCMMDVKASCSVCAYCARYSSEKNIFECDWAE